MIVTFWSWGCCGVLLGSGCPCGRVAVTIGVFLEILLGVVVVGLVLLLLVFSVFLVVPFKVSCSCLFSILQGSHTSSLINISLKRHLGQRIVILSFFSMQ